MKGLVGVIAAAGLLALAAACAACIDTQEGEVGFYTSPCSGRFRDLLQCGRESGAADPQQTSTGTTSTDSESAATCQSVCELIAGCIGITDPTEIADCATDCATDPDVTQPLLDCIQMAGCDFSNACQ